MWNEEYGIADDSTSRQLEQLISQLTYQASSIPVVILIFLVAKD
jgi:hypothetical protein